MGSGLWPDPTFFAQARLSWFIKLHRKKRKLGSFGPAPCIYGFWGRTYRTENKDRKENEGLKMNHKLKKQLTQAVLILVGLFALFAIVGQFA